MRMFIGQCLQGAFTKVLEKPYIKGDLGLLFLLSGSCPQCTAEHVRVCFVLRFQTFIFYQPSKKHVQLYLSLPHCIISDIFIPSGTNHCSRPSLQELSSHALETASCWASGPHISTLVSTTDISVYEILLLGGSLTQVSIH